MKKRLAALFLTLALCLSLSAPALAADFSDVPAGHNFYAAIMDCAEKGIVSGYGDGTFQPSKTVTRSNFAVMLSRAFFAGDIVTYTTPAYLAYGSFVPNYFALFVNGILHNTSFEELFKDSEEMSQGISRYDMAQLIANIMKQKGFSAGEAEKAAAVSQIADYASIPSQYQDAVASVYALGIIGGYAGGSFGGTVTMNRGQAAVVIYRMAQYAGTTEAPEPPAQPAASADPEPEAPTQPAAGRTLSNGKPITEENITEILNQLKSQYPTFTSFVNGYAGLNSGRTPYSNCINQTVRQYTGTGGLKCSTTIGCGGWAAFVADEIFGQTGVTWRKTDTSNLRPGDLMVKLDNDGYLEHVCICTGSVDGYETNVRVYSTDANSGTNGYVISWNRRPTSLINSSFDCYTAYPD